MNSDHKFFQSIALLAGVTGLLMLISLIAMRYTDEVAWSPSDFIFAGALLFGTGFTYILITKKSSSVTYKVAVGSALAAGFLLIWVNAAFGIIGTESNPINLMYFGVVMIGFTGAIITRFQARGMVFTMFAMVLTQALIAIIALVGGYYQSPPSSAVQIISVNGFFIMLFVVSALLFRYAAQEQTKPKQNTSTGM